MYYSFKKLLTSAALVSFAAVGYAQTAEIQASISGSIVPAQELPAVGVMTFDFNYQSGIVNGNLNSTTPLYPNEVKLSLVMPPEIQLSNSMTVLGYSGPFLVNSSAWSIVLDPDAPNIAIIKLVGTINPGIPTGTFNFTIPYTCTAPIVVVDPVAMPYNWTLTTSILGEGRNINVVPHISLSQTGTVLATNESLPITFNYFTTTSANCQADLSWGVEKEEGWETYVIERSKNGLSFEEVGSVKYDAASLGKYEFTDKEPINGANFYRVKASQPDGHSYLSPIKRTTVDCDLVNINVFPNPTESQITVSGLMPGYIVRMYDLTGRMITNTVAKRNDLSVDLSAYPANVYKLVVTAADGTVMYNTKVTKK